MSDATGAEQPSSVGERRDSGWIAFASCMLVVSGGFKIFDAMWAFAHRADASDEGQTLLFEGNLAAWGWVWLAIGIVLVAAGVAVVSGAAWARWFGIVSAGITVITISQWIYYRPLWTILGATLAILLMYALATRGDGQPASSSSSSSRTGDG